ncbi:MAG: hypothetical protein ERJ67_10155 [Aphanocapsa feldmannii 277cV]|uniref:Uncharacterized protein n=1 Tax=Aphanocapsa feldmannii 277cV TaxID=2507553 RepID=A0A524RL60_9CHRO|nr:MAG: hypothetical protein ERJ67_10155 [Aphanocapsa feldmannii 277cV]
MSSPPVSLFWPVMPLPIHSIRDKKQCILKREKFLSSIGLPLKRHSDAVSCIEVPVTRKKRPVALPPIPEGDFIPEPTLKNEEYDYILTVIDRLSLSIERSRVSLPQ